VDKNNLEAVIQAELENAEVVITGEGCSLAIEITSSAFEGLNRVKRQQKVYACLSEFIKSGELHAVSLKTYTPDERGSQ